MFSCFKCERHFVSPDLLITHLKYVERLGCLDLIYYAECGRRFDTWEPFRKHLREHEPQDIDNGFDEPDEPMPEQPNNHGHDPVPLDVFKAAIFNSALTFCAKLYNFDNINRKNVQNIVTAAKDYLAGGFLNPLRENINLIFSFVEGHEDLKSIILLQLSFLENSFRGLETEHLRVKALYQSGAYIPPEPYDIAHNPGIVTRRGHPIPVQGLAVGHHVPMSRIIQQFFELPGVLNATLGYMNDLRQESNVIKNVTQGTLWKDEILPKFAGKVVLPINLFGDEFEPVNSLGSHAGSNKIMAVHFSFPSIPQEYQSKLENIFVTCFVLNENLSLGLDNCFHPVIRDLISLQQNGVNVTTDDGIFHLYFPLTLVRGDNLGVHSLLGFVESCTANYCCRFCKVFKDQLLFETRLEPHLLRTVQNYAEDVAENDVSLTGVNSECIFNVVPNYHCVVNQYVDVMHDIPEGVLKYAMCNILHYLINERNFFTFDTLHMRMNNFDYGSHEVGNTPPFKKITPDRVNTDGLNLSASEMLCFTIFFAELVGDFVPEDDPVWELYLTSSEDGTKWCMLAKFPIPMNFV